jgi:hypothetical protein
MRKIYCLIILVSVLATACKKSDDNGPDGNTYKMLAFTEYQNGQTVPYNVTNFLYDNTGNLMQTRTVNYGDTYMGRTHFYISGILQYAYYTTQANWWDTVFYYYSTGNRLDSTVEHDNDWGTYHIIRSKYVYNMQNQVTHSLARVTDDGTDLLIDSMFYTYTGNNITGILWYVKHGAGPWTSRTLSLYYDSGKNYYKTMGLPGITYFYWSENNMVRVVDATTAATEMTRYFTAYNDAGYPTEFRDTTGGTVPRLVTITYDK